MCIGNSNSSIQLLWYIVAYTVRGNHGQLKTSERTQTFQLVRKDDNLQLIIDRARYYR